MEKQDAHVHSPFCPHGSKDKFEQYINQAIEKGFTSISFTEHAPLPTGFSDPAPAKDSCMEYRDLEAYIIEINRLKKTYSKKIIIKAGLEVDYISGYEEQTRDLLDEIGPLLDDSILSVHYLKCKDQWICIDYSPDSFQEAITLMGGINQVYQLYFQQVLQSVHADLGSFKPKRIGHITLVSKFQKKFPPAMSSNLIDDILKGIVKKGYSLDLNAAGLRKPLCRDFYPDETTIKKAKEWGVPLIYGSDAHQAKEVGSDYEKLSPYVSD